jgi:hypothetical protein
LYTLEHASYDENAAPLSAPPKDRLLAELILNNPESVVDYVFHDNLFENLEDEKLTPEECEEAWNEYNQSKHTSHVQNTALAALLPNFSRHIVNGVQVDPTLGHLIQTDSIFYLAVNHGLNPFQATTVTYIKLILHILLDKLPPHLRGGVVEFGTISTDIITSEKPAAEKTNDAVKLFHSVIPIFRQDRNTAVLLENYCRLSHWLSPPSITIMPKFAPPTITL